MSWFNTQPVNDADRGRQALTYFHNDMTSYSNYNLTLNQLIDQMGVRADGTQGDGSIFLDGFGFAITSIDMSDGQVQDAMQKLASASQGRIPAQSAYFKALSDRVQDISTGDWIGALPSIAADSAIDLAKGAQKVGDSVIKTGAILTGILPIVAVGAVLFIVAMRSKQLAGV